VPNKALAGLSSGAGGEGGESCRQQDEHLELQGRKTLVVAVVAMKAATNYVQTDAVLWFSFYGCG
jgi:hypothetical protein